jgi:hypothetical protein
MQTCASAAVSPRVFHGADIALDDGRRAPLGSWHRPKKTTGATSHPPTFTIGSLV